MWAKGQNIVKCKHDFVVICSDGHKLCFTAWIQKSHLNSVNQEESGLRLLWLQMNHDPRKRHRKLSLEGRGSCMRMERSDKANPHKYKRNVIGWCLYSQCESSEKSTSFRKMNITWQKARVKVAYSCQKQELEKNILMCELIARKEMRPVYKGH